MGSRRYPEKLATNYQPMLHKIPEGRIRETFVSAYKFQELLLVLSLTTAFNPLTPKDHYRCRTAPLTSKVAFYIFVQQL